MRVSEFHFDLPEELIAQHPPAQRGASRMLVMRRSQAPGTREQGKDQEPGWLKDAVFRDLPNFLQPGDLLVLNDSRVLPARLFATRAGLSTQANSPRPAGRIEVLLTEEVAQEPGPTWRALVKPAKKVRVGERLEFRGPGNENKYGDSSAAPQNDNSKGSTPVLTADVIEAGEFGERTLRFHHPNERSSLGTPKGPVADFYGIVSRIGHMPLPPYIRREQVGVVDSEEDRKRYQTVYAQQVGSAAAPTAGLHFTPDILDALRARGVEIAYVTLHVGLGTFQPVRVERVEDIRLHAERYTLPKATADALNRALAEGRRVIAVGTTTTRTLEHIAAETENAHHRETVRAQGMGAAFRSGFEPHSGATSIFIGPGYRFRVVQGLLTNFHLPESTLLMLVSAFVADGGDPDEGRRRVLAAYEHAVQERYRFFSYGDCMLVM